MLQPWFTANWPEENFARRADAMSKLAYRFGTEGKVTGVDATAAAAFENALTVHIETYSWNFDRGLAVGSARGARCARKLMRQWSVEDFGR